jgi:DNA-binding CsgD family transcriptional regulator/tetratricopeptide (TPR) repeat protein
MLILEDLHDADADTLAVLDYLVDNAGKERLIIAGTCRATPGAALSALHAAQNRRAARVVELHRLPEDQVRDLAANCLGVGADAVPAVVLDRLLATADGIPLHVEELLAAMVADGVLAWTGGAWTVTGPMPAAVPASLRSTLDGRIDRLGAPAAALLQAAALFGRRFPAVVAGAAAGVHGPALFAGLREAVDSQLLVPDDDPQWYAFRHALTAESLLGRPLPLERAALARRAAAALDTSKPLFDGAEQLAGGLWSLAGEPAIAAERLTGAGRRATAQGAVSTAISLLERAHALAADGFDTREALIDAYAVAGRVEDAYALGAGTSAAAPPWRSRIHLRLADVATAAGHWRQGLQELAAARLHAGAAPDPALAARMDAVQAQLVFGDPTTPDRLATTIRLAERALRGAEATGQPEVSCSALKTLGRCARLRHLAEADAHYERGLAVAEAHGLVTWKISFLYHLGADQGIRNADDSRLREALTIATEAGAIATALFVELELSVVRLCRGELEAADAGARHCEETAARLRLTQTQRIAVGVRIIVAGHRARRSEVEALTVRFRDLGGEDDDFSCATYGMGTAFCCLLHEEPGLALAHLDGAADREARQPTPYLSLIHGPHLLLSVLSGRAGAGDCARFAASAQNEAAWNRQFLMLAQAVVHGRAGRPADAGLSMAGFTRLSAPYPVAHHLGLRLVAQEALGGGWGEPVAWLRTADAYFHDTAPRVARACRALMREAGTPVPQHRRGSSAVPPRLRRRGVTVRECEVLDLVAAGLTNQQIGVELFVSSRTVEKHVASLLAKTGAGERRSLAAFAAESG